MTDRAAVLAMHTAAALARMHGCVVCRGHGDVLGAFAPTDRPAQLILYAVCDDCLMLPIGDIEEAIARQPTFRVREAS